MNVTQVCEFECCYLIGKDLNSHRYKVEVTVGGPQREIDYGYVIEFSTLSEYVRSILPNNSFLFCSISENLGRDVAFFLGSRGVSITGLRSEICAESLCNYICTQLQELLNAKEPGIRIIRAVLRETSSSYVTWTPNDSLM